MENPMNKWMIWGYHYFWKHPNTLRSIIFQENFKGIHSSNHPKSMPSEDVEFFVVQNFRSHSNEGVLDTSKHAGPQGGFPTEPHLLCSPQNRYRNRQDLVFFSFPLCRWKTRWETSAGRRTQHPRPGGRDNKGEKAGDKRKTSTARRTRHSRQGGHKALRNAAVNCSGKKYANGGKYLVFMDGATALSNLLT